eukprot:2248747-Pyramimonas_sp.AAC.1
MAVEHRRANAACRLQDARHCIGAVFDDAGTGAALAGLAWDRAEDRLPGAHSARLQAHDSSTTGRARGVHITA